MDELAAAAAVLNVGESTDAQASGGVGAPGDGSARDNPASPEIQGAEAEKENNKIDAATQEVGDTNPQVSKHPLPPLHSPFAQPLALHDSHACRAPCAQVTVDVLLAKAIGMFPEGVGAPKAFAKVGTTAAKLTNGLLEIAKDATDAFFRQRGYKPTTPAATKAKLGYALDKYETAAYLVTGAMHLPLISKFEAWFIGKRINNIIGASGTIGSQLKPLRKRGKAAASQVAALLRAPAALNFDDPPPRPAAAAPPAAAPAPSPPPPPPPMPLPPPMPPPSTPLPPAAESSPQARWTTSTPAIAASASLQRRVTQKSQATVAGRASMRPSASGTHRSRRACHPTTGQLTCTATQASQPRRRPVPRVWRRPRQGPTTSTTTSTRRSTRSRS